MLPLLSFPTTHRPAARPAAFGMYQSESDGSESDGYEAFPTTPDRAPNYTIKMADAPPSARKKRPQTEATGGIRAGTATPGCPKLITLEGNIGVGKVSGVRPVGRVRPRRYPHTLIPPRPPSLQPHRAA